MFELPSLEGVEQVMISQQVVEGTAGPFHFSASAPGNDRSTTVGGVIVKRKTFR
jgi:hypothetical protein